MFEVVLSHDYLLRIGDVLTIYRKQLADKSPVAVIMDLVTGMEIDSQPRALDRVGFLAG
jgi:hypothetical protein